MTKRLKLSVVFVAAVISALSCPPFAKVNAVPDTEPQAYLQKPKYNQFEHKTLTHQQECGNCHKFPSSNWNKVRTGSDAFADITEYPQHDSCIKCHKQQFYRGTPPAICSICHTNPGPRISTRHPFPNPREIFDLSLKGKKATSDFVIGFPHDKHVDIVAAHRRPRTGFVNAAFVRETARAEESCSVCHKTMSPQGDLPDEYLVKKPEKSGDAFWLKRGTFKSTPIGHTTCFTCHSADTGILPAPETCSACHKLKPPQPAADYNDKLAAPMGVTEKAMLDRWRRRDSSGTFRHEWFSHAEASCSTCHNVLTMNTADPLTKKVSMSACATCHATPTSDDGGALNFEADSRQKNPKFDCTKCHVTFGKLAIPKSHLDALSAATGK